MGFFTLKCHNSFQNKYNRKATHSFAPRLPFFKLQQEVWKFNDRIGFGINKVINLTSKYRFALNALRKLGTIGIRSWFT